MVDTLLVSSCKSSSTSLYHLNCVDVTCSVRVPDGGGIFQGGADKGLVCLLFGVLAAHPDIPFEECQGLVRLLRDVVDMCVPKQWVLGVVGVRKMVAVDGVAKLVGTSVVRDGDHFAFLWMELHQPSSILLLKLLQILLEFFAVVCCTDFRINQTVICATAAGDWIQDGISLIYTRKSKGPGLFLEALLMSRCIWLMWFHPLQLPVWCPIGHPVSSPVWSPVPRNDVTWGEGDGAEPYQKLLRNPGG